MRPISLPRRLFATALAALATALVAACGNDITLPDPTFENVVDTIMLSALTGTPLDQPSAYDVVFGASVRTDRTTAFDFAFDLDGSGTARIHPAGTLGLTPEAGVLLSEQAFSGILTAPLEGYVVDSTLTVTVGTVFVVRSRATNAQCLINTLLPRYGKFHVLEVDATARTVTLELLVDLNCGYRGLEPGTPED